MVTALLDDNEKQEENDGVMLSSKSADLVEQMLCNASIGLLSLALEGVLSMMLMGSSDRGMEMTVLSRCVARLSCLLVIWEEEDLMAQ
eukprot:14537490-Ditylum_brightwellii.AAC.1